MKANRLAASLFLVFLIVSIGNVSSGEEKREISPFATFWWSFFLPGGGHFYLGEAGKGAAYFIGTAGLVGWGIAANEKRVSDEINAPLVYAQQLHAVQIYTSYREAAKRIDKNGTNKILKDQSSLSELARSPFRRENLKSPWVIGFALLGAGVNYAGARLGNAKKDFWNIRNVQILGERFNRDTGMAAYSAYWIPLSLGAGVSEEAIFRGMVQTDWDERWGKKGGLLAASALFGVAHYDGKSESIGNILFAAAAGMFLGWRFQERDYRLSEPIAEHFWFDALAGITLYLADPENNPLGAKAEYKF